ncbi:MAG: hypothetical protein HUU35_09350, partial [Armatimonadetes bacterium]|nr:hypothetical protein [Armatimonadota bacterium]
MALASLALLMVAAGPPTELSWGSATLRLDDRGRVAGLVDAAGRQRAVLGTPFCRLRTAAGLLQPESLRQQGDRLVFAFPNQISVTYQVTCGEGYSVWELTDLRGIEPAAVESFRLAELGLPDMPTHASPLNAAYGPDFAVALLGTKVNVNGLGNSQRQRGSNLDGVTHTFQTETTEVKQGSRAARFAAVSKRADNNGWSVRYRELPGTLDLTGLTGIRAWVHGDGRGEMLKFQLHGVTGVRDDYLKVDFTGWREVTLTAPALNSLDPSRVRQLALYYNALPANTSVETIIDHVRAMVKGPDGEREVVIESFEDDGAELWDTPGTFLRVETVRKYGITPASFAIVACPRERFTAVMDACEAASGLPNPHPGGWSKTSPWTKRSYLFITSFGEKDVEQVIEWAKRGGFGMVLIGSHSWNLNHGHYDIEERMFPGGLATLKRATDRLHAAGLRVGLHFLAPSVYPNDPYLTPKPDPRLVKGASASLAAAVDASTDFIATTTAPQGFPTEDGGYTGSGTVLQIGDELVQYNSISTTPPYGFGGCRRGLHGTTAAPHAAGEAARHLVRSYGYFMFDLDSTLADEVTGNVAKVANAIGADMLYFDGSERLQGDHWYYNAKLQSKFYEKLDNKNTLLQGSSYSHYSWHLVSRMASADGHGDVKGYLDERTPSFAWYAANLMPLDCGWYYVYDPEVTLDQYDYILQRCLGFDASISVQTNPHQLATHPEAARIFDLCSIYERLRLSGKVPASTLALLREPKREYRLLRNPLRLRRTVFGEWRELAGDSDTSEVQPAATGARLGLELRCGTLQRPGPSYHSNQAVPLEEFEALAPYLTDPANQIADLVVGTDKAGSTSGGVTHQLGLEEDGPAGRCARYTATSTRQDSGGWSVVGRRFDPPLDLSAHRGLGFWLKGDGKGGKFKVQLRDQKSAVDYYLENDFTSWRYIQLDRERGMLSGDLDYGKIAYLAFYYNALPAKTSVTCWFDGLKALPALDSGTLTNPILRVGDREVVVPVVLAQGERLIWHPGEAPLVLPAKLGKPRVLPLPADLPLAGKAAVSLTFG